MRWLNYISSGCKFPTVYTCQKLWKLASSWQSYCKNKQAYFFGPPCSSKFSLALNEDCGLLIVLSRAILSLLLRCVSPPCVCVIFSAIKAKIHYTSFPLSSPYNKLATSPLQVRNINDKSVTSWRRQKSVVSVVSCRLPNSITTTCYLYKLATSPSTEKLRRNLSDGFWPLLLIVLCI